MSALQAAYNDPLPFLIARETGSESQALLINAAYYGGIGSRLNAASVRTNAGVVLAGAAWAGALFHISLADLTPSVRVSLMTLDPSFANPGLSVGATLIW